MVGQRRDAPPQEWTIPHADARGGHPHRRIRVLLARSVPRLSLPSMVVHADAVPNASSDPGRVESVHYAARPRRTRASGLQYNSIEEADSRVQGKGSRVHAHGAETVWMYRRLVVLRRGRIFVVLKPVFRLCLWKRVLSFMYTVRLADDTLHV